MRGLKLAPVRPITIHKNDRPQSRTNRIKDSDLSSDEGTARGVTIIP